MLAVQARVGVVVKKAAVVVIISAVVGGFGVAVPAVVGAMLAVVEVASLVVEELRAVMVGAVVVVAEVMFVEEQAKFVATMKAELKKSAEEVFSAQEELVVAMRAVQAKEPRVPEQAEEEHFAVKARVAQKLRLRRKRK